MTQMDGNVLKLEESILLKWAIYRFNTISKTRVIFHRTSTKYFKICVEKQNPRKSKATYRKKNRAGGTTLPDFRLYYKDTVLQWYSNQSSIVMTHTQTHTHK